MSNDTHVAIWKSWWIRAVGLVVLIAVAGLAWFLTGDRAKPAPTAASAPAAPAPGVGVRLAAMKGVSQSFEFVGRIKAIAICGCSCQRNDSGRR